MIIRIWERSTRDSRETLRRTLRRTLEGHHEGQKSQQDRIDYNKINYDIKNKLI